MSVPVLTVVVDPRREAELADAWRAAGSGIQVVRRCVDLADALAAAGAGLARAALVSADLRHLDRDAVTRLQVAGVAVVGLTGADGAGEERLRRLGVDQVIGAVAPPEVAAAVQAAVQAAVAPPVSAVVPAAGWTPPAGGSGAVEAAQRPGSGRVVAVWGPAGAPGRTTVAVNLAAELARLGGQVLLLDADSYGASVAQLLGMLDEAPSLVAACRLANTGALDGPRLGELAVTVRPSLRLLTGINRPQRWPELRPAALDVVLDLSRTIASTTVVDCGFCLEDDEELSYDTAAPRRNGAALRVLETADVVLAVTAADPVGLARYVRARPDLTAAAAAAPLTVVNRLRARVAGPGDPWSAVSAALARYAGIDRAHPVPDDPAALDAAVAAGRTLEEVAPKSPARLAIQALAQLLHPARAGRRTSARAGGR